MWMEPAAQNAFKARELLREMADGPATLNNAHALIKAFPDELRAAFARGSERAPLHERTAMDMADALDLAARHLTGADPAFPQDAGRAIGFLETAVARYRFGHYGASSA